MANARATYAVAGAVLAPALTLGLSLGSFALLVVPWVKEFHVARSLVMGVVAILGVGATLITPLIGWLVVRFSPRSVMAVGVGMLAAGLLVAASASAFWVVGVSYVVLIGLGMALAGELPAKTVALSHFPDRAGAVSGLMALAMSLLGVILPIAVALLLAQFGWRTMLQAAAAALVLLVLPIVWFLMVMPLQPAPGAARASAPAAANAYSAKQALRTPAFWLIILCVLPLLFGLISVQSNVAVIAHDAGIDVKGSGYLVSLVAAGAVLGAVVVGWLADRLDLRLVYTVAAAIVAVGAVSLIGQRSFVGIAAGNALLGLAGGGAGPLIAVLVVRSFGAAVYPRVAGLLTPFLLPISFGPVAAGAVRDATGSYNLIFVLSAALCLPGALAIWRFRPASRVEPVIAQEHMAGQESSR